MCLPLGTLSHQKDWLTFSGGTDRSAELLIFLSQMTLLRWLTFLPGPLTAILTVLLFFSVSFDFSINSKWDALFHGIASDYTRANWDGLHDHLRDTPWEYIFKLSACTAASEFYEWPQVGIDVYIAYHKYQVKPHSSPWFSAPCAAAIVHRNHFFRLYQQNKSSQSKAKFRQTSNCCKRVLETARLALLLKQNSPSLPRKLVLDTFGELLIMFSTKVNLLHLLY